MLKLIRRQLLKIERFRALVLEFKIRQQKRQHHKHWAQILSSSGSLRTDHKTLAEVSDDGIRVDYMDGRRMGQRHVVPLYIDSTNWGGMK